MLAFYQMTPSISSDFFGGSPWETKRSDDLSEARSAIITTKSGPMFSFRLRRRRRSVISIETFVHFLKNPRKKDQPCQISVRPNTSQCEYRCRVCAVAIPIRRRARALSSSGRLITTNYESVYTLVSGTFCISESP